VQWRVLNEAAAGFSRTPARRKKIHLAQGGLQEAQTKSYLALLEVSRPTKLSWYSCPNHYVIGVLKF
jgi:hypothetical protein